MRLTPGDELDIRWYVLEAGAALGERSPFGVQLEMARDGLSPGGTPQGPDLDRASAVIRRFDTIRRRLQAMPRRSRRVLVIAYCHPCLDLARYDKLGTVMPLTEAARDAYRRAAIKAGEEPVERVSLRQVAIWLDKRCKSDVALRDAALAEADAMLSRACADWSKTRFPGLQEGPHNDEN